MSEVDGAAGLVSVFLVPILFKSIRVALVADAGLGGSTGGWQVAESPEPRG